MRHLRLSIAGISALLFSPPSSWAGPIIHIAPGHQKVISASGITRAAIGNPEVADVKTLPSSDQVIVTGRKPGSTDLILWKKGAKKESFMIEVSRAGRDTQGEIRNLLNGVEGVDIRSVGGKLILDGRILRGSDFDRIQQILRLYPGVVNFTRVHPSALEYLAHEIESRLKKADIANVHAQPGGESIFLEGSVARQSDPRRAGEIAKSIYAKIVNNIVVGVEIEPLILIDVKMMEVKTSALGQFGLKWPSQISATDTLTIAGSALTNTATVGQGAILSLQALIERGSAKILSNPKLLCRSGTKASFLAGGEIPIRLIGERTASILFKEYGVGLEINARSDATQNVMMDIEAKISELDPASAVDNVPGILEHRVKTAANLKFGETVVLGGLLENRARKNIQKVPLLGHIPILGELFKSRAFQQSESEFLVFMTPLPADPKVPNSAQAIQQMNKAMEKTQREIDLSILD